MFSVSDLPDKKETALYKMCMILYNEYQAIQTHQFNPELDSLLKEVVEYLQFDVYPVENEIVVTFVLDKGDIPNGRD
jgi:hypothetical protein